MHSGVIIITGAAGGIGLAIAKTFLNAGCTVVALDLEQESVDIAVAALGDSRAAGYACDVTHEQTVQNILTAVYDRYGKIDVLVNNAGLQHVAPLEQFPTEKFRQMLDVMLTAPFIAIKHVLPYMKGRALGGSLIWLPLTD